MQQLTLSLDQGLSDRWDSLRECLATQVYNKGHGRIAGQLDLSPSKLTEKLAGLRSDGKASGITVDELERYIDRTKDHTPIFYLVDKYLRDPQVRQAEALAKAVKVFEELGPLLKAAGLVPKGRG